MNPIGYKPTSRLRGADVSICACGGWIDLEADERYRLDERNGGKVDISEGRLERPSYLGLSRLHTYRQSDSSHGRTSNLGLPIPQSKMLLLMMRLLNL
ncbi:hypothetical protein J5N97_027578 [Dioscorea zingiberensis]|uniref:Uncharacterized protein n=1 Tax=Dioscorea zingiberensis TaxID=325984 RepID=A0A9D5C4G7_9LILI|nr:hypothetical protein J5N97_027578 [Dioscorea zingiberensis]